jgi:hypothetical protein
MHDDPAGKSFSLRLAIVAATLGSAMPLYAAAAENLPPEHTQGSVAYRSGGIGEDEATAMKEAAVDYPLEVLFVERDAAGAAAYLAGSRVAIRDGDGRKLLDTVSAGPMLLARLPPGRYTITAWRDGHAKVHGLTIAPNRHERLVFEW